MKGNAMFYENNHRLAATLLGLFSIVACQPTSETAQVQSEEAAIQLCHTHVSKDNSSVRLHCISLPSNNFPT